MSFFALIPLGHLINLILQEIKVEEKLVATIQEVPPNAPPVDDMITMQEMHEALILDNLFQRYNSDKIYASTS